MASVFSIGTSVTPLLESRVVTDPFTDAITTAVLGKTSIVTELMLIESTLLSYKVEEFYKYTKDHYSDGLPIAYNWNPIEQRATYDPETTGNLITDIIEDIEGETIQIFSYDYGYTTTANASTAEHYYTLYWEVDYNSITNQVDPRKVRYNNGLNEVRGGILDTFTVKETKDLFTNEILVTYDAVIDSVASEITVVYTPRNTIYTAGIDMFRIEYTKDSDNGTPDAGRLYWWVYTPSLHEFPTLNKVYEPTITHDYYPVIPVRINTYWVKDDLFAYGRGVIGESKPSPLATTSREALKRLDLDIDTLTDAIAGSDDIDNVSDAFVAFTVPIDTDKEAGMLYLYEFYSRQRLDSSVDMAQFNTWYATDKHAPMITNAYSVKVTHNIQHPDSPDIILPPTYAHIDLRYEYNYIHEEVLTGVIADVGKVTSLLTAEDNEEVKSGIIFHDTLVLRKQITSSTYSQVTVHGLIQRGNIDIKGNPIDSKTYGVGVQPYVSTVAQTLAGGTGFYLLIERSTIDAAFPTNSQEIEALFTESLTLVINAVKETHLEWYQTEAFEYTLKFIGIVISIYTLNPTISALFAAATWTAAAYIVAELAIKYIIMLLIAKVMMWVVEKIGGKYALILAAIIAIAAAVVGITGIDIGMYMPSAEAMLQAVNAITSAVTEYAYDEMVELQRETEDFLKDAEAKQEELDAAEDLLFSDVDYDLLNIIVNPPVILDESPDQFFNRTIHIGNPGVLSLNAPNDFVSNLLTLPDNLIT